MARMIVVRTGAYPPTWERFNSTWAAVAMPAMEKLCSDTIEVARQLAPVGMTEVYRDTLDFVVERRSDSIIAGVLFSGDEDPIKAQVIEGCDSTGEPTEFGRQPGTYAPVDAIQAWTAWKFGLDDPREIQSTAFLVNRKIFTEGIPAVRPILTAVEGFKRAEFDRVFLEDVPAQIMERL